MMSSLLAGIPLFETLTPQEMEYMSLFCQERFLRSGTILMNEGDEATAMYIVKSGRLRASRETGEGHKFLGYIDPYELVGEMAIFDGDDTPKRRMATVEAVQDTLLLVMMNYSILELAKKHKDIYEKIGTLIRERKDSNSLIG